MRDYDTFDPLADPDVIQWNKNQAGPSRKANGEERPEPQREEKKEQEPVLDLEPLPNMDSYQVSPRPWIVPGKLLRQAVSLTISPPGVGKTAYQLTMALAVCTGLPLLGEEILDPGPVWFYSNEETREEILRRLSATMRLHRLRDADVRGRLHIGSGIGGKRLMVATKLPDGSIVNAPQLAPLLTQCSEWGIRALFLDPIVSIHDCDENSNGDIERVFDRLRVLAYEGNMSVDVAAHINKTGQDSESHIGNMNAMRGASAAVGAARVAHTLARMSPKSARDLGVSDEERPHLVRVDPAKGSYVPPVDKTEWLEMRGVCLDNDAVRPDWVGVFSGPRRLSRVEGLRDEKKQETESSLRVYLMSQKVQKVGDEVQWSSIKDSMVSKFRRSETSLRQDVLTALPEVGTDAAKDSVLAWEKRRPPRGGKEALYILRIAP